MKQAQASLEQARQALGPQGADNPQIREALAALEQARLDLTRTTLLAPGDGVVSNLQLNTGQFAAVGQPALTFLDTRLVWLQAFLRENSLEYLTPGARAEVVLDVLPGRVLPARLDSVGWGVGEGDVDPTTGLPKTRQGTADGWHRRSASRCNWRSRRLAGHHTGCATMPAPASSCTRATTRSRMRSPGSGSG